MVLSFWVIMNHIYQTKNKILENIIIKHRFHVPTFFIISFYFLGRNLSRRDINKINERLVRLIIPYIMYPALKYLIYDTLYIIFKTREQKIKFSSFIIQLLIGRDVFGVLWFHFNLIFLTIFFYIISFFSKNIIYFFFKL